MHRVNLFGLKNLHFYRFFALAVAAFAAMVQLSSAADGTWQKISSLAGQPPPRYNSATNSAVYAPGANSMVFFGGYNLSQYLGDAWKLDLSTFEWSPLASNTSAPPARLAHSAVYDAAHNRMVIYGGFSSGYVEFQDLWAYDFNASQWNELSQGSVKPGDRAWAATVYNPRDTSMILFAGQNVDGDFFNDIWILNLNQLSWTKITPQAGWPAPRVAPIMVLDEAQSKLWMFGGFYRTENGDFDYDDLWSFDLSTRQWAQYNIAGQKPAGRDAAPSFFEPNSRAMVLFGGIDHNNRLVLNDLWAFSIDSKTWKPLSASGELPAPRHNSTNIFVPAQNRLYLFGGLGYPALTVFGDAFALTLGPLSFCSAARGDMNANGSLGAADVVLLLNCVFLYTGVCDLCFADVSCNGILNAVDVVVLLNAVFLGAPLDCNP